MRALLLLLAGCSPETITLSDTAPVDTAPIDTGIPLDTTAHRYVVQPPEHLADALRQVDNTPIDNPLTDEGAALGRVLFWDPQLSVNGTRSCASCHVDVLGHADDQPLSEGFDGELTGRKSMPLVNVRYYRSGRMFWDERAASLEDQVLMPIQDDVEMGLTLEELERRVADAPLYGPLFEDAFGDAEVTTDRIARALAQFVRSMTSFDSAWDQGVAATDPRAPFPNYTAQENRGKTLFFGDHEGRPLCNACHLPTAPPGPPGAPPPPDNPGLFFMPGPRVNGTIDPDDSGVAEQTGVPADRGAFKSPSLRNVELRAPYFHDGRFATLEEVVAFYDHEVQDVPNLHPTLRNPDGSVRRLDLSSADQAALVAFLKTLTDPGPALDPRFSDPFSSGLSGVR